MFSLYITDLVLTEDELKNLTLVEIENCCGEGTKV